MKPHADGWASAGEILMQALSHGQFPLSPREVAALKIWCFDPNTLTLTLHGGPYPYEIDLQRCRTSAQMLDWVMQIAVKRWADDRILASLVRAFDAILRPQATLCSLGHERGPIDAKTLLAGERGRD